jgi:hypothetical protein
VRRPLVLLLLAVLMAPASAASACDVTQVESLETRLPAAPGELSAGRTTTLALQVTRAGQPAAGIEVFAALRGKGFATYRTGLTGTDGRAVLRLDVPRDARGPAEMDVQAHRTLIDLPCAALEEYDRVVNAWGRVR